MDLENDEAYMVRGNGALIDWMMNDSATVLFGHIHRPEHSVLRMSFDNQNTTGSYIHYDGKRQTFGELLAGGELRIKDVGTLYGMASYKNGSKQGVSLNYNIHPEDYAPYLVSDTLGAHDMHQEVYTVMAGFSFGIGKVQLGADAFYEGIAQASTENPRHSGYSHQMRVGVSGGKVWRRDAVSLKLSPEWSRQSISARSMQEGVRYFGFYGFGLWNRRESKGGVSYGRMQTLRGVTASASWMHGGRWNWTLSADYRYRSMHTEESNFKNLFSSVTYRWQQQLLLHRRFRVWELYFRLAAAEHLRDGAENVYEQMIQNEEQGLYDYVKVGTNRLYTRERYTAHFSVKAIRHISLESSVGLVAGADWLHSCERYKSPVMKIQNRMLTVSFGAEYKFRKRKSQWELGVYTHRQQGAGNRYLLPGESTPIEQVTAFIPYQLRGEGHRVFGGSIACSFDVTVRHAIGARLATDFLQSSYRRVSWVGADVLWMF